MQPLQDKEALPPRSAPHQTDSFKEFLRGENPIYKKNAFQAKKPASRSKFIDKLSTNPSLRIHIGSPCSFGPVSVIPGDTDRQNTAF